MTARYVPYWAGWSTFLSTFCACGMGALAVRRVTFTDPTGAGLDVVVDAGHCCLSRAAIAFLAVGG